MAIRARDIVEVMIVAVPAKARVRRVAIHAETVLGVDRRRRVRSEDRAWRRPVLSTAYSPGMISRWAVAGFALQLAMTERSVRVCWIGVRTLEQNEDSVLLMAREAAIGALAAVFRVLTASGAGSQET
jgi:hypothetical protein